MRGKSIIKFARELGDSLPLTSFPMLSVIALRPSDIICSTTDAAIAAVIRAGIGFPVSHCMTYVGG
jgi:hypothetical protein